MNISLDEETGRQITDLIAPITQAWTGYQITEIIINPSSFPQGDRDKIVLNARLEARRKQPEEKRG